jgi:hypothetical protein
MKITIEKTTNEAKISFDNDYKLARSTQIFEKLNFLLYCQSKINNEIEKQINKLNQ